jgi:c-di-GMP-related signal transduction protein
LLSPEFLAFDASLRAGARGSIVIEVEKVEIFADLGAYLFARDFVRERGYRLCLDGMTRLTLPYIDRARLGLDLVKLFWSPDMADRGETEKSREFIASLDRVGKSRIILARCDTDQAIEFGLKAGVKLFQGRIIDKMLAANAGVTLTRNRLAPPTR